jgi:hypothetical protein
MLKTKLQSLTDITLYDQLGFIKAEIAHLQDQEKAIKEQIIAQGFGSYNGQMFDVTVSPTTRDTLDMEAVRAKLSPQFIRSHTKTTTYPTIRVTARKGN